MYFIPNIGDFRSNRTFRGPRLPAEYYQSVYGPEGQAAIKSRRAAEEKAIRNRNLRLRAAAEARMEERAVAAAAAEREREEFNKMAASKFLEARPRQGVYRGAVGDSLGSASRSQRRSAQLEAEAESLLRSSATRGQQTIPAPLRGLPPGEVAKAMEARRLVREALAYQDAQAKRSGETDAEFAARQELFADQRYADRTRGMRVAQANPYRQAASNPADGMAAPWEAVPSSAPPIDLADEIPGRSGPAGYRRRYFRSYMDLRPDLARFGGVPRLDPLRGWYLEVPSAAR